MSSTIYSSHCKLVMFPWYPKKEGTQGKKVPKLSAFIPSCGKKFHSFSTHSVKIQSVLVQACHLPASFDGVILEVEVYTISPCSASSFAHDFTDLHYTLLSDLCS